MDTQNHGTEQPEAEQTEAATEVKAKRGRPRKVEEPAPNTVSLTFDQFKELLAQSKSSDMDPQAFAEASARAHQQLNKKENDFCPEKSVYSYPEGDRERPRPEMRCDTYWCGDKVEEKSLHTVLERELMNRVSPGSYLCSRPDGSTIKVDVIGTYDHKKELTKVEFTFPVERNMQVPSMTTWLREMIEQSSSLVLA